ncbi:unnamed protein product [Clonostachys chloroleuca]|uniref:Autophagy-related protein n=1 Tax=Clonostachys chloroleuca TaxID=1926264 RepID=A0AA35QA21_9HYPO|nr:unnamed protein product [Clonostachys chloroleuca]
MAGNLQPPRPQLQGRRHQSGFSHLSKDSHRSFATSAFEADDELSYTSDAEMSSRHSDGEDEGGDVPRRLQVPAYSGHDARPTSQKELAGWYMYAFASETYMVCGIGSFIPILLETLARENGYLVSDPTKPCGSSESKGDGTGPCVVDVIGIPVNTASFAMYTFSASVLLQALLVVSISCAADHGAYRKKLLLTFAWIGSVSVMCYIFITKTNYILGSMLTIISNTAFGASFVLLNSFLPVLVRNHPEVIKARDPLSPDLVNSHLESRALADSTGDLRADSTSPLLDDSFGPGSGYSLKPSQDEVMSKEMQISSAISAKGVGIGYCAGLFLQCVAIVILLAMKATPTWAQRVVLFIVGAWWTIFTIPAAMWLRPRPGPPLTDGSKGGLSYIIYAWKSLFRTILLARRLVDIIIFLAAWFLLSDAIATTSSTAILFAKTQLHMKAWALGMINVITTLCGVVGAFGWSGISKKFNLKPHHVILVCIGFFELIPLYGLLGYLPFVQRWGVFGLQEPWEMYPLAALYGLILGGLSSYCRSLYGELIPPGSEAAFYALFAITDKGSSVFGPAIVGAIIDSSGTVRPAFWFLAALIGLPAFILWFIDVERGKIEGGKLARAIEGAEVVGGGETGDDAETRGMIADYEGSEDAAQYSPPRY